MIKARSMPARLIQALGLLTTALLLVACLAQAGGVVIEDNFRDEVIRLTNEERAKEGLPALVMDTRLEPVAEKRAKEASEKFSHTRPNGKAWKTAFEDCGIEATYRGENLAYGQKTPARVVKAWMASKGHKANIMNDRFTSIYIGICEEDGVLYWSQMFMEDDGTVASAVDAASATGASATNPAEPTATPQPAPTLPEGATVAYVNGVNLNLRALPNSKTEVITIMADGTQVEVLQVDGKWAQVRLANGTEGWASTDYLRY